MKNFLKSLLVAVALFGAAFPVDSFAGGRGSITPQIAPSSTFASLPAASTNTGRTFLATDVGTGVLVVSDGTKWKPVGGIATIAADSAPYVGAGTAAEANYKVIAIPAGIPSATGSLRFNATGLFTNTNGTKTMVVRHSNTSGDVATGTVFINNVFGGSNTALTAIFEKTIWNTSASTQVGTNGNIGGYGTSSSTTNVAGTVNTAIAHYLNFNVNAASASDTAGYQGIVVFWIEP